MHVVLSCLRERGLWVSRCSCGHATPGAHDKRDAGLKMLGHLHDANFPRTYLTCGHAMRDFEHQRWGAEKWCPICMTWEYVQAPAEVV